MVVLGMQVLCGLSCATIVHGQPAEDATWGIKDDARMYTYAREQLQRDLDEQTVLVDRFVSLDRATEVRNLAQQADAAVTADRLQEARQIVDGALRKMSAAVREANTNRLSPEWWYAQTNEAAEDVLQGVWVLLSPGNLEASHDSAHSEYVPSIKVWRYILTDKRYAALVVREFVRNQPELGKIGYGITLLADSLTTSRLLGDAKVHARFVELLKMEFENADDIAKADHSDLFALLLTAFSQAEGREDQFSSNLVANATRYRASISIVSKLSSAQQRHEEARRSAEGSPTAGAHLLDESLRQAREDSLPADQLWLEVCRKCYRDLSNSTHRVAWVFLSSHAHVHDRIKLQLAAVRHTALVPTLDGAVQTLVWFAEMENAKKDDFQVKYPARYAYWLAAFVEDSTCMKRIESRYKRLWRVGGLRVFGATAVLCRGGDFSNVQPLNEIDETTQAITPGLTELATKRLGTRRVRSLIEAWAQEQGPPLRGGVHPARHLGMIARMYGYSSDASGIREALDNIAQDVLRQPAEAPGLSSLAVPTFFAYLRQGLLPDAIQFAASGRRWPNFDMSDRLEMYVACVDAKRPEWIFEKRLEAAVTRVVQIEELAAETRERLRIARSIVVADRLLQREENR